MNTIQNTSKFQKIWAWVLSLGGLAGMIAMTWQASERIAMLKNPSVPLSCNLNPIIDCGTVLENKLAALFGFPNAFIGMIVFASLALSGIFMLSGTKPNKAYRNIVMILSVVLSGFSVWFFGVSLYIISKICIFCLVGWVVSFPIFVYSFANWASGAKSKSLQKAGAFFQKNHINIIVFSYIIMALMYFLKFQEYYFG